jgi:hypothetical protein
MKKENIGLIKLFEEIVNEVGDLKNISSFNYKLTNDGGQFYFEFEHQKCKCNVNFTQVSPDMYYSFNFPPIINHKDKEIISVGFDIEGTDEQYLKSNPKLLFGILKTVTDIIKDSLHKYPENCIFVIMATSKTGSGFNDPQKMNLYKLILQQNLPTGYRMGEGEFIGNKLIFLTKNIK